MLNAIVVSIRFILLIFAGQKQVALENAALRQQLAVFDKAWLWTSARFDFHRPESVSFRL